MNTVAMIVRDLGLCLAFKSANVGQVSCGDQGHSGECDLADGVSYRDVHEASVFQPCRQFQCTAFP